MKILNSLGEVSEELKVENWIIQKQFEKYFLRSNYMMIGDITVYFQSKKEKLEYVVVDDNKDEDCKQYMMQYELKEYHWEVKTDDIVGIEKCKVIDVTNKRMGIIRATVVTELGTQLNRRVIFITDKEDKDYKQDGCIYYYEKE